MTVPSSRSHATEGLEDGTEGKPLSPVNTGLRTPASECCRTRIAPHPSSADAYLTMSPSSWFNVSMTTTIQRSEANTTLCLTCAGTGTDPDFGDECANCNGTGHKRTAGVTVHSFDASDKQIAFLTKLRDEIAGLGATQEADALTQAIENGLDKRTASKLIDQAIAASKAIKAAQRQAKPTQPQTEDGFYLIGHGDEAIVVKVQWNRAHTNLYAKQLDPETGRFEYTPGLVARVAKEGRKLTLEEAKHLGHLYGRCCCCGATLTDEDSIEAGIGPICASKL